MKRASSSAVLGLVLAACSSEDKPEAGNSGNTQLPLLPPECDVPLPSARLVTYTDDAGPLSDSVYGITAAGDSLLYINDHAVWSVTVPDGTPVRLAAIPQDVSYTYTALWADDASIVVAADGQIFTAPRAGGELVLVPGFDPQAGVWPVSFGRYRDDFIYFATLDSAIYRQPVAGGPPSELVKAEFVSSPVVNGGSLYYMGESSSRTGPSIWSIPLTGGSPTEVAPDAFATSVAVTGNTVYGVAYDTILKFDAGVNTAPTKLSLPANMVFLGGSLTGHDSDTHDGAAYFATTALYQLPDDRRQVWRVVVIRADPGQPNLEIRCVPPPPFDATLSEGGQGDMALDDLAVSDAGVFVLEHRDWVSSFDTKRTPYAVKVFP